MCYFLPHIWSCWLTPFITPYFDKTFQIFKQLVGRKKTKKYFKKCRSISQIIKAATFIQRSLALQLTHTRKEEKVQRQNSHKTSQHFHKIHKHQHHLPFINPAFLVSLNLILQLLYSFNVSSCYFIFLLIKLNFGIECICQTTILQRKYT